MSAPIQIWRRRPGIRRAALVLIGAGILAFLLAGASNKFITFNGWASFLAILLVCALFLILGWEVVKKDSSVDVPNRLGWLLLTAVILRLAVGTLWYVVLPVWGYGSPVEEAGYIMSDAHARDTGAWVLASSKSSLLSAFTDYHKVDQYGGLLYLSALVYRYAGGGIHFPLQIVALIASISSIALLFTYAFARRVFGEQSAWMAAWIVAIFPDAVILGSSQMREGFLMTLVALAAYGVVHFRQERSWVGLGFIFVGLVFALPFSPPVGGVLLLSLAVLVLSLEGWQVLRVPKLWIVLGSVALLAGVGIWLAWGRIAPEGITNPVALIAWWIKQSARWQAVFVRRSSILIRRIFKTTPEWSHVLILMGYGVVQPFLPAAIMDTGNPLWKGIAIWRAIGWTAMLAFLLVAPLLAWLRANRPRLVLGIALVVWGVILIASLRSGGDLWDNPRYRVVYISLEAIIAGWVWFEQQQSRIPWLSWMAISLAIVLIWFIPWYLQRYDLISWPVTDIFLTIGLGLATATLFLSWKLFRRGVHKKRILEEKNGL
jgi:hypothetical protein